MSHSYYPESRSITIILEMRRVLHNGAVPTGRANLTSSIFGGLIMKRIVLAVVAVIAMSGFAIRDYAMTSTPPPLSAEDESAVRALINEFANTWNRHDM